MACGWLVRNVLLELLSSDDTMARRAAAEGLAQMGLKVGDGYAVYLIQVTKKKMMMRVPYRTPEACFSS